MDWIRSENSGRPGSSQPLPAVSQGINGLPALRFPSPNNGNSHTPTQQQSPRRRNSPHSQIPAPSIPSWARPQQTVTQQSHQTSLPVLPKSPSKQQLSQETVHQTQDEAFSRPKRSPSVASQNPQFRVVLKSSPLKPSQYKMVEDDSEPPSLSYTSTEPHRHSRKRPEPGAMGVRNMMSAALTGGSFTTLPDPAAATSSNDGGSTGASIPTEHINKRGRPKGWKPGMSYAAIRGNTPAKPYVPKPKATSDASGGVPRGMAKRGRKPGGGMGVNTLTEIIRKQYSRARPVFTPYICEWVDESTGQQCPAELHNWETLKRHVFRLHTIDVDSIGLDSDSNSSSSPPPERGEKDKPRQICRWGSCTLVQPPRTFPSKDLLDDHLEAHLSSVAWHMGDGFRNRGVAYTTATTRNSTNQENSAGPSLSTEPAYLFSKTGEQATPSIKDQVIETEKERQERRRRLRLLMDLRNENAPEEDDFLKQTLGDGGE